MEQHHHLFLFFLLLLLLSSIIAVSEGSINHHNHHNHNKHKHDDNNCISNRGTIGEWHDFATEFASAASYSAEEQLQLRIEEEAQYYVLPLYHATGLTDTRFKELQLKQRAAPTYSWRDNTHDSCSIDFVTRNDFCDLMENLNTTRILFIGDELTQEQAISLFMLLKLPTILKIDDDSYFQRTVHCWSGFAFQIVFIRNDELLQTPMKVSLKDNIGNCCHYRHNDDDHHTHNTHTNTQHTPCFCYPWFKEYTDFDGRSIVVANTGLHITSVTDYQRALDGFIQEIQGFAHQNDNDDIIVLRNNVPGHAYCQRPDLKPYKVVEDFIHEQSHYGQVSPAYNLTVQAQFNHVLVTLAKKYDKKQNLQVLDIFAMTILRPDGHLSEDNHDPRLPPDDCIRYSLPGVIDWWNHLLFSNLKDLVKNNNEVKGDN